MTRRPSTNLAASVRARLLNLSRETGEDFQFLLQRYAAERFLFRLGVSAHRDRYILKGAMLFALWGGSIYRSTRDLDFAGYGGNNTDEVLTAVREVCTVPVADDGIVFDVGTFVADPIRDDAEYNGLRIRFQATLDGARIPMQIDIGFGNAIEPPAVDADYPTLLDSHAPHIRAYPHEAVVAEKLHAMVVLGERNSRFKDFYDVHVLAHQFPFDGEPLVQAIAATFERRRTAIENTLPAALAPRFYADGTRAEQWRAYLTRNKLPGAPADFGVVGELLQLFLVPPWHALASRVTYSGAWRLSGPWQTTSITRGDLEARTPLLAEGDMSDARGGEGRVKGGLVGRVTMQGAPEDAAMKEEHTSHVQQHYKPYPFYKDSGVEWLGEIPEHWEVYRLKHLAALNTETLAEDTDSAYEMVYVDIGSVDSLGRIVEREQLTFASAPSRARRLVRDGDVIVSTVRTYLRAIAPISNPDPELVVSTGFAVVHPEDGLTAKYASYALRTPYFVERVVANSKGVSFPAINESEMATYELTLPPEPEQRAIAAFLDRETARIDALVGKKERLISLLQEKRIALISRAVTKGLDPSVPMKDSGVEWFGEIPMHWEVRRLKTLASVQLSNVDKKTLEYQESVRLCNYVDVYYNERITSGLDFMVATATPEQVHRFTLRAGDVLITKDSESWTDIAVASVVTENLSGVLCGYHLAHIRSNTDCYGFFLARAFMAIGPRDQFRVAANGITRFGLGGDAIRVGLFPTPPEAEQHAIAVYLDRETERIDALVAKIHEAIERLKELRTAIISAAVTGQIDVREG